MSETTIPVYLERGKKRTFAGAIEWLGWCRGGKDEASALQALIDYAPRYAKALQGSGLVFTPPKDVSGLHVVETLPGNASTDFGAPVMAPSADAAPLDERALERLLACLRGCWRAFDGIVERARGGELRKGPRGGGRDLEQVIAHVAEGDASYLRRLAWRPPRVKDLPAYEGIPLMRAAIVDALQAAVHHGLPEKGPRGGAIWLPRYFVRRVAWHTLDHAWEIEDRLVGEAGGGASGR